MNDFDVITPAERDRLLAGPSAASKARSPRTVALMAGKILFLTAPDVDALRRTLISLAKHHGKRARTRKTTRNGVGGLVVWWEDRGQ